MTNDELNKLLDLASDQIDGITYEAYQELLRRVNAGESPRDAIAAIQQAWAGRYQQTLADAFSRVMQAGIGTAYVQQIKIGPVTLSDRLYQHNRQVQAVVRSIVQDHIKGQAQARDLALAIYEGYGFKAGGDPLAVKADLPKYLRTAIDAPEFKRQFAAILARGQAATIKTPAMRQAYLNAIQALQDGAGADVLAKQLKVAMFERNRFFGNRIAQTELARAHADQRARELMDDSDVLVVQWKMSITHPRLDICDLHASVDLWGLGKGLYPKDRAPMPPAHPFCRCTLVPRLDKTLANERHRPEAIAEYIGAFPISQGGLVAGSLGNRLALMNGKPINDVIYRDTPAAYKMRTVGQHLASPDVAPILPETDAYAIAKAGGANVGILKTYADVPDAMIARGIASMMRQVVDHQQWISDPATKLAEDFPADRQRLLQEIKWPADIQRLRTEADVLRGILKERKA